MPSDLPLSVSGRPIDKIESVSSNTLLADSAFRHRYAIFGVIGGLLCQTFFFIYNFYIAHEIEAFFDLSSIFLLIATLLILTRSQKDTTAYRIGVFTILYICSYTVFLSNYESGAAIQGYFAIPVALFYLLGIREGIIWLGVLLGVMLFAMHFSAKPNEEEITSLPVLDIIVSFGILTFFSIISEWFRQQSWNEFSSSRKALEKAARELQKMEGLVPICSYCKSVRDDNGYWRNLENYLKKYSHALISTGICRECAKKNVHLTETSSFPLPNEVKKFDTWRRSDEQNRQRFLKYAVMVGAPVILAFSARSVLAGQDGFFELAVQFIFTILLIAAAVYLHVKQTGQYVYQFGIAVFFGILTVQFFTPTPNSTDHFWLYIFPVAVNFILPPRSGIAWTAAMLVFAIAVFASPMFTAKYGYASDTGFFFLTAYPLIGFFTATMASVRHRYAVDMQAHMALLEQTYESIKTLKGLVPVCRVCKSIHNDKGFWEAVDTYLLKHTDLLLTHSICEECLAREMPDLYAEMKAAGEI